MATRKRQRARTRINKAAPRPSPDAASRTMKAWTARLDDAPARDAAKLANQSKATKGLHDATAAQRKEMPIVTGVLDYFPDAIAELANVSFVGNQQHNPGQPMHWARGKSQDHADCMGRHLTQRGTIDTDGIRHSAKLFWRAAANLQLELEAAYGLKPPRGCTEI